MLWDGKRCYIKIYKGWLDTLYTVYTLDHIWHVSPGVRIPWHRNEINTSSVYNDTIFLSIDPITEMLTKTGHGKQGFCFILLLTSWDPECVLLLCKADTHCTDTAFSEGKKRLQRVTESILLSCIMIANVLCWTKTLISINLAYYAKFHQVYDLWSWRFIIKWTTALIKWKFSTVKAWKVKTTKLFY